jgi:hypothetical protein
MLSADDTVSLLFKLRTSAPELKHKRKNNIIDNHEHGTRTPILNR